MKTAWLALFLLAVPAAADNQAGVAVDHEAETSTWEVRLTQNTIDFNVGFDQKNHGGFLADFEMDRMGGRTYLSPAFGYQLYTKYSHFQPFASYQVGDTHGAGDNAFTAALVHGLDFRLSRRYSLRYEHEDDWSKVGPGQWQHRNSFLLVVRLL